MAAVCVCIYCSIPHVIACIARQLWAHGRRSTLNELRSVYIAFTENACAYAVQPNPPPSWIYALYLHEQVSFDLMWHVTAWCAVKATNIT